MKEKKGPRKNRKRCTRHPSGPEAKGNQKPMQNAVKYQIRSECKKNFKSTLLLFVDISPKNKKYQNLPRDTPCPQTLPPPKPSLRCGSWRLRRRPNPRNPVVCACGPLLARGQRHQTSGRVLLIHPPDGQAGACIDRSWLEGTIRGGQNRGKKSPHHPRRKKWKKTFAGTRAEPTMPRESADNPSHRLSSRFLSWVLISEKSSTEVR